MSGARSSWTCVSGLLLAAALVAAGGCAPPSQAVAVSLLDLHGREVRPLEHAARVALFLFVRTDCPISNRYAPVARQLHDDVAERQVQFWLIYPGAQQPEAIRRHLADFEYPGVALRDPSMRLVALAGVRVTPEAALFDASGRLVYHGRIDDSYVDLGRRRRVASAHDVRDALAALLAGRRVPYASQPAVGCFVDDLRLLSS